MAAQEREFSRIISWEVFNFMSVEHGVCEFDESNIINIKGYNDSGKSAMLRALDVVFSNMRPTKQIDFIQDGKEYFRVVVNFSDGISILRDKYINGQSLYEMWKDNECIFTTKKGNALTKVTDVPQPIKDYLCIVSYDDIVLNSRSCFEKQLGVQTTGSENYKLFNAVLKSEEIASAGAMLNNDKNKLLADINAEDQELNANKTLVLLGANLTETLISYLKDCDTRIDFLDSSIQKCQDIITIKKTLDSLVVLPKLEKVETLRLDTLIELQNILDTLKAIEVAPKIPSLDMSRLELLEKLTSLKAELDNIVITENISKIETEKLDTLLNLMNIYNEIKECNSKVSQLDKDIELVNKELDTYIKESEQIGVSMVKCPSCGKVFDSDTNHID